MRSPSLRAKPTPEQRRETYRPATDYYAQRGQALSEQTPFENVDAIATTQLFAQQQRLTSLPDLRRLPSFTLGARPEFADRVQGLAGLQHVYGLTNAEFKPIEIGACASRWTRATSTPRTSSPPTGNSRAGTTGCSRIPSGCSASSTWPW